MATNCYHFSIRRADAKYCGAIRYAGRSRLASRLSDPARRERKDRASTLLQLIPISLYNCSRCTRVFDPSHLPVVLRTLMICKICQNDNARVVGQVEGHKRVTALTCWSALSAARAWQILAAVTRIFTAPFMGMWRMCQDTPGISNWQKSYCMCPILWTTSPPRKIANTRSQRYSEKGSRTNRGRNFVK
jgi:hypothetical protein